MIIATSDKNAKVVVKLKELGYKVVNLESKDNVSAILYNSKYEDGFLDGLNEQNPINSIQGRGVLLLDIRDKDINSIDAILRNRLYTPLF